MINDNILSLLDKTPQGVLTSLATRVKARRLEKRLTQAVLAARAGMSLASYRRFERTGEISCRSLVLLAIALDCVSDFDTLFSVHNYVSLDDLLAVKNRTKNHRK